jgi:hypothetical protein
MNPDDPFLLPDTAKDDPGLGALSPTRPPNDHIAPELVFEVTLVEFFEERTQIKKIPPLPESKLPLERKLRNRGFSLGSGHGEAAIERPSNS